jgi:protoporphyrinogen oxidase
LGIYQKQSVAVLGAGPGGLCAAWNLVQDGYRVIVFEKEPVCGGLAATFERDGYRYDLGPHNIHARRPSIHLFLKRILGQDVREDKVLPQIYFRKRRIDYPLFGIQVLRSLPWLTMAACGLSFLWCRTRLQFSPALKDDVTYETWVVNRFGRRFYDIFFGPYTRKTWGIPPKDLSDIVAKKRFAVRGLSELINSVLFKREFSHPENPRLVTNLYPRRGVGEISDFFAAGIREGGGTILTSCTVGKMVLDGNRVAKICYSEDGKSQVLDFQVEGGAENWQVISTIPINQMVLMLDGNVPPPVREAAGGLDFASMILLYLNLNQPDAFGVELLYFSEEEFPFNRIYDVGRFSRAMVPEGKNAICIEMTCSYGDEVWNMDEKALFEKCMLPLEKHGLLGRDKVEAYHIRRLSHTYPRFRVGYQQKLRTIFNYLADAPNLITLGRQGLFSYANVDDVIWMAFEAVKELPYRDRITLPIEELLPDYIDF